MAITPIKKESISDQVFEQLKANLIDGTWKPGDKIPSENELTEAFGISRVTVRQALSRLAALGLIETRLGEGSFVREIKPAVYMQGMIPYIYLSEDSTREVLHFRLLTEPEYAADAAEKLTEEERKMLKQTLKDMEQYQNEVEKYVESDAKFHAIIAEATGNSLVIQLNMIIQDTLKRNIQELSLKVGAENGLKYHRRLIHVFEEKNGQEARKIMREHLDELYQKIV